MSVINSPVVIIVAVAAVALIIWLIRHDQQDKTEFVKELAKTEVKPEADKDINNN